MIQPGRWAAVRPVPDVPESTSTTGRHEMRRWTTRLVTVTASFGFRVAA